MKRTHAQLRALCALDLYDIGLTYAELSALRRVDLELSLPGPEVRVMRRRRRGSARVQIRIVLDEGTRRHLLELVEVMRIHEPGESLLRLTTRKSAERIVARARRALQRGDGYPHRGGRDERR